MLACEEEIGQSFSWTISPNSRNCMHPAAPFNSPTANLRLQQSQDKTEEQSHEQPAILLTGRATGRPRLESASERHQGKVHCFQPIIIIGWQSWHLGSWGSRSKEAFLSIAGKVTNLEKFPACTPANATVAAFSLHRTGRPHKHS